MSLPDLLAQATILGLLILAIQHRDLLNDMTDGNVERLEREERNATEARWWLEQMGIRK
jgi:hypothetical protein